MMNITRSMIAIAVSLTVSPTLFAQETLEKTRVEAENNKVEQSNKIVKRTTVV